MHAVVAVTFQCSRRTRYGCLPHLFRVCECFNFGQVDVLHTLSSAQYVLCCCWNWSRIGSLWFFCREFDKFKFHFDLTSPWNNEENKSVRNQVNRLLVLLRCTPQTHIDQYLFRWYEKWISCNFDSIYYRNHSDHVQYTTLHTRPFSSVSIVYSFTPAAPNISHLD